MTTSKAAGSGPPGIQTRAREVHALPRGDGSDNPEDWNSLGATRHRRHKVRTDQC